MPGVTLITGVSSGIGLETAILLALRGWPVVGTMRNLSKREAFDKACREAGVNVPLVALDLQDEGSVRACYDETVTQYGAVENLVNNAGVLLRGYFEDLSDREVRSAFETNVFGAMTLTRLVIPGMRAARNGRIVFLSSIGGLAGSLGLCGYCATKFAVEGWAESLALEMALWDVRVSLVEPGIVKTPMWAGNLWVADGARDPVSPNRAFWEESERVAGWAVETSPITPVDVARKIERALTDKRPRMRYLVGSRPAAFLLARRFLPTRLFEKAYHGAVVNRLKRVADQH